MVGYADEGCIGNAIFKLKKELDFMILKTLFFLAIIVLELTLVTLSSSNGRIYLQMV